MNQSTYKNLSNTQLETELKGAVAKENDLKIKILHLLAEVETRRLYSKTYPSLFEYCTRELKYSASSAQRRIDTMRAMKLMPEIEQKLQSGELQLSSVSQAQVFFRQESKTGKLYSLEAKREVLAKLENKSARECERELVAISPRFLRPDYRREIANDQTELRVTLDQELVRKLDHLKSLLSNKHPHLSDKELIEVLADMAIKKLEPRECSRKGNPERNPARNGKVTQETVVVEEPSRVNGFSTNRYKATTSRYVPAAIKREIWLRDKGKCTHLGCGSSHRLQYDHIVPVAKGGQTTIENLRLLCQTHNLLAGAKGVRRNGNREIPRSTQPYY